MNKIQIDNTDIFLENIEFGKGKITISNTYGYNFSHYWGSMGNSLEDFLLRIDSGYFIGKLCSNSQGDFSGKRTVKNIRKVLREEFSYEIPWYKNMEAMKELRKKLKNLETCSSENEFFFEVSYITKYDWFLYIDDRYDAREFKNNIESLFSEVHYYFEYEDSREIVFLKDIFKKLQKHIRKCQKEDLVNT